MGDGWSPVTDHVTYFSVRPDTDRVLPSVYAILVVLEEQALHGYEIACRSCGMVRSRAGRALPTDEAECVHHEGLVAAQRMLANGTT